MNLAFNFHDKLFWIHNFLPKNTYKEMYIELIKNRNKLNFKKTAVDWTKYTEEINDMSESYCQYESKKLNKYLEQFHIVLKYQPFVNILDSHLDSHIRKYKYGQHLTWHSDDLGNRGYASILGNSIVIIKSGLHHKVNANLKKTHPRLSIQTWINKG